MLELTCNYCAFDSVFWLNAHMDALAERSKAVAQGAVPQGRGLEPHRRQHSACKAHAPPLDQIVQNITNRSKHGCDTLLR